MITLSVVIVSYNTKFFTLQTLDSLFTALKSATYKYEVILVENASTDGSLQEVIKTFEDRIDKTLRIIQTPSLIGFGQANNLGSSIATGEFILFLNSDVIVSDLDAINKLVAGMKKQQNHVLSVQLLNEDGSLQFQGGSLPGLLNIFTWATGIDHVGFISRFIPSYQNYLGEVHDSVMELGWIGGTAFCIRKQVFDTLGRWDENIYMYGEDTELSFRAKKAGYKVGVIINAQIIHLKNKSTGSSASSRINEMKHLVYIFRKHYSQFHALVAQGFMLIGCIERIVYFGILRRDVNSAKIQLQAAKAVLLA